MRRKNLDNSTNAPEVTKRVYDDRIKLLSIYGTPIPKHFIDEVREDMKEWSDKETSLRFKDFLIERRINSKVFYDWCNRDEELQQEYEWTLAKIASRREIGAITRKFDSASALRMMPRYDEEWIANEIKLAEIKKIAQGEASGETKIMVVLPEIASSPLVPELKKDENE